MADRPHFSVPFRFVQRGDGTLQAAVNEQDTIAEIADAVEVAARTVRGQRVGLPEFGRPDELEFTLDRELAAQQLQQALQASEPRASLTVNDDAIDPADEGLLRLRTLLGIEGGEA